MVRIWPWGIILLLAMPAWGHNEATLRRTLRLGDLVFQDLDCGELCDAIEAVTQSAGGASFSHVGVVAAVPQGAKGDILILEAYDGVTMTPLKAFLARSPQVKVGRLRAEHRDIVPAALAAGRALVGAPYDDRFMAGNGAYYCSELVHEIFRREGRPLFPLEAMTFGKGKWRAVWEGYFGRLGGTVPEGAPGINPGALSRSPHIEMLP